MTTRRRIQRPVVAAAPRATAFTLLELLVVIGTIAILASLLLPALNQGRAQGQRAQCLSQLKQWNLALHLYADDNDDFIPRRGQGVRPLGNVNRPEDWFNALPPYLATEPLGSFYSRATNSTEPPPAFFRCPVSLPQPGRYFLSYGMNLYLSSWSAPDPNRISDIDAPSSFVFLADGGVGYASTFPANAEYSPQPRHRGSANLAFLDGHAESFRGPEIGCNTGMVQRADVVWQIGTNSPPFPTGN